MIRKGDTVIVNAGREKSKTGKVLKVIEGGKRLVVEKINMVKKHSKPSQKSPTGGIVDKEAPLPVSNAQIFCTSCNKGVRTGYKMVKDKKVRYCKKCEKTI